MLELQNIKIQDLLFRHDNVTSWQQEVLIIVQTITKHKMTITKHSYQPKVQKCITGAVQGRILAQVQLIPGKLAELVTLGD